MNYNNVKLYILILCVSDRYLSLAEDNKEQQKEVNKKILWV